MSQYRELLKEVRRSRGLLPPERDRPLKKRKKNRRVKEEDEGLPPQNETRTDHEEVILIPEDSPKEPEVDQDDVVEVKPNLYMDSDSRIDVKYDPVEPLSNNTADSKPASSGSEEEFDSDEFENVDLDTDTLNLELEPKANDQITVSISLPVPKKPKKKATNIIDREEKRFRKSYHMIALASMACLGIIRNNWINDQQLLENLKKTVPRDLILHLNKTLSANPDLEMSYTDKQIQSRRLLDSLRKLMEFWNENLIVNRDPGIYKKRWNQLDEYQKTKALSKVSFCKKILKKRGSKDILAQGFVALLRSVGLQTRLVFSLQPPDFTNNSKMDSLTKSPSPVPRLRPQTPSKKPLKGLRPVEKIMQQFRNRKISFDKTVQDSQFDSSFEYPVFWAEVWDKFSKNWISVDAICFQYIEVVRVVSKFESPSNDERNNTYYVLGYDNDGRVRDITRRYAKNYNAKTRKKRITREDRGELWYNRLLTSLNSDEGILEVEMDIKESEYFNKKSLQEGMPNSIQDFKNHPVYVLEDQLKSNEIISPKVPCGRTRKKNSKSLETIPVYKRENVHVVRSAKAWYLRGRILKTGERPMMIKTINAPQKKKTRYDDDLFGDEESDNGDVEDSDKRLYLESQTELYVPPLLVDGEVPTNAYGNIDLYVPSMLPANACYRESKYAIKAAKSLGIDYAEACVGFEFSKGGSTTLKLKGVVVAIEFEDAMAQVESYLELEEKEKQRRRRELEILRKKKLLLTKLRIRAELNKKYGSVDGVEEVTDEMLREMESEVEKVMNKDDSDEETPDNFYDSDSKNQSDEENDEDYGGGFLPQESVPQSDDDVGADENTGGGFMEESDHESGGFIVDDEPEEVESDLIDPQLMEQTYTHQKNLHNTSLYGSTSQSKADALLDDEEYLYDPALQQKLMEESKIANDREDEDLYTMSKSEERDKNDKENKEDKEDKSENADSDVESVDSLELANKDILEEEGGSDEEYYNDDEFEYSDDE